MKKILWIVLASFVLAVIIAIINAPPPKTNAERLIELEAKIGSDAVIEMERDDYGDTFSRIGAHAFERANKLARWPALTAAASERCDSVEIAAISDRATSDALHWFVDCANGERFRITETEAIATKDRFQDTGEQTSATVAPPAPESAAFDDLSEADVVSRCDIAVQSAMKSESSFDTAWQWELTKHAATGRVTVVRDFEAENAFGASLSSQYECIVNAADMELVSLRIREGGSWKSLYSK